MKQEFFDLEIQTEGKSLVDISETLKTVTLQQGFASGLITLWCTHTGASLLIQASSDDDVIADIEMFFERIVPQQAGVYRHKTNEPDNAPSHLRALLTQTQVSIPIEDGKLPFGKVQSLFLFEHRETPKMRKLKAHFIGT